MQITLAMVASVDGKTTHPTIHGWSSSEDQSHLRTLKLTYPIIIMGRKTYETVKNELVLSEKTRRIILTKHPEKFIDSCVPGQLEFTDESPIALANRLGRHGPTRSLLVGGSDVNELFLKAKLITDCYITIEPRFFGDGKSMFTNDAIDVSLKLIEVKQLNTRGTLLLHYSVDYEYTNT